MRAFFFLKAIKFFSTCSLSINSEYKALCYLIWGINYLGALPWKSLWLICSLRRTEVLSTPGRVALQVNCEAPVGQLSGNRCVTAGLGHWQQRTPGTGCKTPNKYGGYMHFLERELMKFPKGSTAPNRLQILSVLNGWVRDDIILTPEMGLQNLQLH